MPRWQDEIRRRLATANLDPAREAEIAQELEQHLEDRYVEMRAMGSTEEEARRAALDELRDDLGLRRELAQLASASSLPALGAPTTSVSPIEWWRDVRHAARMLRRTPGFTVVAILTLALGIGTTVAITGAVYAVLYRPLPLAGTERLVVPVSVQAARGILRGSVPYADYADWREERDVFEQVALFDLTQLDVAGGDAPERVSGLRVSPEYFQTFRVRPLAGRVLVPADHEPETPPVVVIADGVWKRRFGGDPNIAGTPIRIAGRTMTIAGVVPAAQMWPTDTDIWLPIRPALLPDDTRTRRDNMVYLSVARLRDGATIEQARARLRGIADRVAREHASSRAGWTTDVIPLRDYIVEPELRLGMLVLLAGVGFVLLIACVNLANLFLVRGANRAREMALRSALGASRSRLLRQLMTESLVLAVAGGAAGLVLAGWLLEALKGAAPVELPMIDQMRLDAVAFGVAGVLTIGTAVLIGLLPAVAASGLRPADALREGGRSVGPGRRTARIRDLLVVAQMALAIVLLTGAGLMVRSFQHLVHVDPGVDVDRLLAGRLALPYARYPEPELRARFYEGLTDALAASPGVEVAAATSYLPAGGRGFGLGRVFLLEGQPEPPASTDHPALWNVVTADYFRTVGIRVIRGRGFTRNDRADAVPVMVINQTMARRVFGDMDPIGRRMRSWRDENLLREVVGIVSDVRYESLADEGQALVYVPHQQDSWGPMTMVVRAHGDPAALADTLRREVARQDADVAVARIATLSSMAAASIAPQRFGALLLALFAGAAAVLAGIGVYGVMSYAVAQRTHELGVRLALGATPRGLFALVVGRGLVLAACGAVLGIAGGLAVGPLIREILYGVAPTDPITLAVVPLALAAVAAAACAIPGRRAARIDPLEALRE